jgi:hypothetical protein
MSLKNDMKIQDEGNCGVARLGGKKTMPERQIQEAAGGAYRLALGRESLCQTCEPTDRKIL